MSSAGEIVELAPENLQISRAIVLDWHDGPVDGFLRFASSPTAWRFRLLGERADPEDLDSRIYLLSGVPVNLWDKLADSLAGSQEASRKVWIPTWQFETDAARAAADELVARLNAAARPPELLMMTSSFVSISEIWMLRSGVIRET